VTAVIVGVLAGLVAGALLDRRLRERERERLRFIRTDAITSVSIAVVESLAPIEPTLRRDVDSNLEQDVRRPTEYEMLQQQVRREHKPRGEDEITAYPGEGAAQSESSYSRLTADEMDEMLRLMRKLLEEDLNPDEQRILGRLDEQWQTWIGRGGLRPVSLSPMSRRGIKAAAKKVQAEVDRWRIVLTTVDVEFLKLCEEHLRHLRSVASDHATYHDVGQLIRETDAFALGAAQTQVESAFRTVREAALPGGPELPGLKESWLTYRALRHVPGGMTAWADALRKPRDPLGEIYGQTQRPSQDSDE